MNIGDTVVRSHRITQRIVQQFAKISTDFNPLHVDPEVARNSRFGKPIAHGALIMSFISAILGGELPGAGSIYLSQTAEFKAPVFVGDTVTVSVTVEKIQDNGIITLRHEAHVKKRLTLEGYSVVLYGEQNLR